MNNMNNRLASPRLMTDEEFAIYVGNAFASSKMLAYALVVLFCLIAAGALVLLQFLVKG